MVRPNATEDKKSTKLQCPEGEWIRLIKILRCKCVESTKPRKAAQPEKSTRSKRTADCQVDGKTGPDSPGRHQVSKEKSDLAEKVNWGPKAMLREKENNSGAVGPLNSGILGNLLAKELEETVN